MLPPTQIIAHRGDHTHAEENTLDAFAAAVEVGADRIELDVRRSQDGILLVFHDAELDGRPLATLTWAEIQARKPAIPTLQETLSYLRGNIALDLELKEAGYEEQVLDLISDNLDPGEWVVTSFWPQVVQRVKALLPEQGGAAAGPRVGLLIDARPGELSTKQGSLLAYCREVGADFLAPHFSWLDPQFLAEAERAELPLYVWTVNDSEKIKECLQAPMVQGLITDRPHLALQLRAHLLAP